MLPTRQLAREAKTKEFPEKLTTGSHSDVRKTATSHSGEDVEFENFHAHVVSLDHDFWIQKPLLGFWAHSEKNIARQYFGASIDVEGTEARPKNTDEKVVSDGNDTPHRAVHSKSPPCLG